MKRRAQIKSVPPKKHTVFVAYANMFRQLTSRREQKVVEKKNTHFFTFKILEHTRKIVNFGAG